LRALINATGGDAETFGLLGRIHKDRWRESQDPRHLNAAIETYRVGFELEPDEYYCAINLATLLAIRGDPTARDELDVVLPPLRAVLERRIATGQADYWELATSLECVVLAGDFAAADALIKPLTARAAASWMTDSTAGNLELLASTEPVDAGPWLTPDHRPPEDELVRDLETEAIYLEMVLKQSFSAIVHGTGDGERPRGEQDRARGADGPVSGLRLRRPPASSRQHRSEPPPITRRTYGRLY
jgi:hypothetical protein